MTDAKPGRLILASARGPESEATRDGLGSLHLINTGEACRAWLMVPVERSVDVATGREIARREERIKITIDADEAREIGPVHRREWSEAMSIFAPEDTAVAGIRFVYGPERNGVLELSMRVFSVTGPGDEPGIPRRYRLPVDGGRRVRLPVLGTHGVAHRPSAPTREDESDLFFYFRWSELPIDEIAFRTDRRPNDIRRILGAAVLRRAGVQARPRRAESLRMFDLLDTRRQRETIDLNLAVEQTGLSADALRRCLDVMDGLNPEPDRERHAGGARAPL